MSEAELFITRELGPVEDRNLWRLWFADVLELATAVLLGWGAVRGLEVWVGPGAIALGAVGMWVLLSLVGGVTGRTLWRHVTGVRLVRGNEEASPGVGRALGRAFSVPVDTLAMVVLQYRPLDRLLGLRAVRTASGVGAWARGLGWQLPWLGAMALAAWFILTPTRQEALQFLGKKLQGWHCCHGTRKAEKWQWQCRLMVARLVRDARREDPEAMQLAADCPEAAERLGAAH
jgi:hypothetical protein